jgi:hypothetical protein
MEQGNPEKGIKGVVVPDNPEITRIPPYEHIYAPWEWELADLYYRPDWAVHPFIEPFRLTVTYMILTGWKRDGGAELQLRTLEQVGVASRPSRRLSHARAHQQPLPSPSPLPGQNGDLLDNFPVPNKGKLEQLTNQWLGCVTPLGQPFGLIREYYGEKTALYFQFSGYVT